MTRILLLFICIPFINFSQDWIACAPVPSGGRDDAATFSLNGYGFLVTGNLGGFTESNKLWRYDPETDSWTEKTSFPGIPRQYAGCFAINGNAYIIGGISENSVPLKDVWKYNGTTDQWSQLNDFPGEARWSMFTTAILNTGFLGTGTTLTDLLADCWSYDPLSDQWTQLPDFPGGIRRETIVFSKGESFYAGLGYAAGYVPSDSWFRYNIFSGEWSQAAGFPGSARSYAIAGAAGSFGYAGTGYDAGNNFLGDMYRYNPEIEEWESMISFLQSEGMRGMSSFTIGETIYFVTGLSDVSGRISGMWKLIDYRQIEVEVKCYPNPATGNFMVKTQKGSVLKIFTNDGKLVRELVTENDAAFLEIANPGIYFLEVSDEGRKTILRILVL